MLITEWPGRASALFFDFDGTLVDLASRPDAVQVPDDVPRLLSRLGLALGGAVAVVSGRPLSEVDRYLKLRRLCVAGVHGVERRGADGHVRRFACRGLQEVAASIEALCERSPGLRMELKPGAIALHYREAPELEDECLAAMTEALSHVDGMSLLRGKKVVEMKPRRASKGMAVRSFMDERPFRLRRPWFFGDDVTDEAAFEAVQAMGGVAVKIGEGDTLATLRIADPAALRQWMGRLAEHFSAVHAPEEWSR
jgi:trehalose 6-phosphate phosphatase